MLFTTAAEQIPIWRVAEALKKGVEKNLLFLVGGGLGDQICAEPTVRFALENFKNCRVSVLTHTPELFRHLMPKLEYVFERERWTDSQIGIDKYLALRTYADADDFSGQFVSSILTNCVDYPAILSLRGQLPIEAREVVLDPLTPTKEFLPKHTRLEPKFVFVHPGKGWPSKTFPAFWWNQVLSRIVAHGGVPVLIGNETVDVKTDGCVDLRKQLTIMESVWLLKQARVLLTNDSSPLHMAAVKGGKAWIGFMATCKRADCLYHYRKGLLGWRMENFSKGGVWDLFDFAPNKAETVDVKNVIEDTILKWLPDPERFARWAVGRYRYRL